MKVARAAGALCSRRLDRFGQGGRIRHQAGLRACGPAGPGERNTALPGVRRQYERLGHLVKVCLDDRQGTPAAKFWIRGLAPVSLQDPTDLCNRQCALLFSGSTARAYVFVLRCKPVDATRSVLGVAVQQGYQFLPSIREKSSSSHHALPPYRRWYYHFEMLL